MLATIGQFCCQNKVCPDSGKRDHGNLYFRGWSGRGKRIRMVYCRTCRRSSSERKSTAFERSRLPDDKVVSILEHLREGCGTRATGRLVGVNANTVTRYVTIAGGHAKTLHDDLVEFSPSTREVQFDEKWGFVGKKEKNRDEGNPADDEKGDRWDHTAIDAESRLLLVVVPGGRTGENAEKVVREVRARTGARTDLLLTSDEYAPYATAIEEVYAKERPVPRTGKPGRPRNPERVMPADLCYATVCKKREKGRVVEVTKRLVYGAVLVLACWLLRSRASATVNTSFVERNNATDRGQNSRKARKSYAFSKEARVHDAATYLSLYSANFCWPVRTLAVKDEAGRKHERTPAMAAGLTDHVWSTQEWLAFPAKPCLLN